MILALFAMLVAQAAPLPDCRELAGQGPARLEPEEPTVGTLAVTAELVLLAWQRLLSPGNGATCQLYPTCSGYARQALHQHGPLIGAVMAFERISSPHEDWSYTPCTRDGRTYFYDPVEANEGWLPERRR